MSLMDQLESDFDQAVRERGMEYVRKGLVRYVIRKGDRIISVVDGTEAYDVQIELVDGTVDWYECTCSHFADEGHACKHLWATLVAAENKGLLAAARPRSNNDISAGGVRFVTNAAPKPRKNWAAELRDLVADLRLRASVRRNGPARPARGKPRDLVVVLDPFEQLAFGDIAFRLFFRDGGALKVPRASADELWDMLSDEDRIVFAPLIAGVSPMPGAQDDSIALPQGLGWSLIETLAPQGRLYLMDDDDEVPHTDPLTLDNGPAWQLRLSIERDDAELASIRRTLCRGDASRSPEDPAYISNAGWLIMDNTIARFDTLGSVPPSHRRGYEPDRPLRFPADQLPLVLSQLAEAGVPAPVIDATLSVDRIRVQPQRVLVVKNGTAAHHLQGEMLHDYDGMRLSAGRADGFVLTPDQRIIDRDESYEQVGEDDLVLAGWKPIRALPGFYQLPERKFLPALQLLVSRGWRIEREGQPVRSGGRVSISVRSGIDWFDIEGHLDFDGQRVALPEVIRALRRKQNTVLLADGSQGIVPSEILEQQAMLLAMGKTEGDAVRYTSAQAGLVQALLASVPSPRIDETFEAMARKLEQFEMPLPVDPPDTFIGTLRPYQREGLGWLKFLQECKLGGCLADDMGLGKTIQVLALLEERRRSAGAPSLAVVPRSLVFNWRSEASKFAPNLRVLDHTGSMRLKDLAAFKDADLVLTTYGTLRRDIALLHKMEFDYVILDESQAIKNASSQTAKAARLLTGKHRLALSGTPIENSLDDLFSLMEFLNPGLLGTSSAVQKVLQAQQPTAQMRKLLARAVRPMILRRTKAQVARDLPERTEQTLMVDLEPTHRRQYDELREHYRAALLGRTDQQLHSNKIAVLESLLRLRQMACHPGLLDERQREVEASKIATLLEQLDELVAEGHKVLIFSQFTSLLALVKPHLEKRGVSYEYLDGQTRNRQECVDRFQNDESIKLFLISLKAGGVGLNLTAADYVFLLDPWWNPAVEAQAIDRAHRIGQTRPVIAYRIIARDTVEEKVLQLQQTKRDLADAIITGADSLVASLNREDLELLLS